ncbi:hypothetical protein APICC_05433 [Apis cerana cerana]|uniref:Uncharacterized protein n=1 Tax=Apis cerana cerana TaxID=94128 RepID=A0A2A3EKX4_APICC|nr:hypothetical protein APICC_05433 [Apis cerana cerana]
MDKPKLKATASPKTRQQFKLEKNTKFQADFRYNQSKVTLRDRNVGRSSNFILPVERLLFECLNSRLRMNNSTRHDNLLSDDFLYYISVSLYLYFRIPYRLVIGKTDSSHLLTYKPPRSPYLLSRPSPAAGSFLLIAVLRIRRSLVAPCTLLGLTIGTGWNGIMRGHPPQWQC